MLRHIKYQVIRALSWPVISWKARTEFYRFFGAGFGADSIIGDNCIMAGAIVNLDVGNRVYINSHVYFQLCGRIIIEDDVRIASFVRILTRWHPVESSVVRRKPGQDVDYDCIIGKGSWIGLGVTILPKVTIGHGCVVAAGAVLTETTEPNGLYAGVPAKRIKDLVVDNM